MPDLVSEAIRLVRKRAALAARKGDDELIHLAAHLFGLCLLLLKERRTCDLVKTHEQRTAGQAYMSMLDALEDLQSLPRTLPDVTLYQRLIAALQMVEHTLHPIGRPTLPQTLPSGTELEILRYRDVPDLGGYVYHWVRPFRSQLAELRDRRFELDPRRRPLRRAPHPLDHLNSLRMYWRQTVLPDPHPVEITWDTPLVRESGRDASTPDGGFRIALCPLGPDFHPRFEVDPSGASFTVHSPDPIWEPGQLEAHLSEVLVAAKDAAHPIHLVIFPELCLSLKARELIAQLMLSPRSRTPYGVVAGSFHLWRDDAPQAPPVNESVLLDRGGQILLRHWKKGRFEIPGSFAENEEYFPNGSARKEVRAKLLEGIHNGSELQILETSLGTMAILICADALEPDPSSFEALLKHLRPDLLLLVSMSIETRRFEQFAEEMARHWIGTIFVNARCLCTFATKREPLDLLAFNLALYEPPGAAPTCVRWPHGAQMPEIFLFHPVKPESKGWQPLPADLTGTGLSWLGGSQALGLVLDLGAHWVQAEKS